MIDNRWYVHMHPAQMDAGIACIRILNMSLPDPNIRSTLWSNQVLKLIRLQCRCFMSLTSANPLQMRSRFACFRCVRQYLKIKILSLLFPILFSVYELHLWRTIQQQERLLWTSPVRWWCQQTSMLVSMSLQYHQSQPNTTLTPIDFANFITLSICV